MTNKTKIIFHYSGSFKKVNRASQVRPKEMLNAFRELGHETSIVSGTIGKRVLLAILWALKIKSREYAFCYSETTTFPLNVLEYVFFLILKLKKIPILIYWRDAQFKREGWRDEVKGYGWLVFRFKRDIKFFNSLPDKIFVQSESFGKMVGLQNFALLPPGTKKRETVGLFENKTAIYVGGSSKRYGTLILMEALKKTVAARPDFKAIVITRKEEIDAIYPDWGSINGVEVLEADEPELFKYYARSSIALMPLEPTNYNSSTLPVKLFEYISYGMPIVSTPLIETAAFIKKNNIGIVAETVDSFVAAIEKLLTDPNHYEELQKNSLELSGQNSWAVRARTVASTAKTLDRRKS